MYTFSIGTFNISWITFFLRSRGVDASWYFRLAAKTDLSRILNVYFFWNLRKIYGIPLIGWWRFVHLRLGIFTPFTFYVLFRIAVAWVLTGLCLFVNLWKVTLCCFEFYVNFYFQIHVIGFLCNGFSNCRFWWLPEI